MASKKQRRRQQKVRRHEYEYVYVDDEGNEVEVDAAEPAPRAVKSDGPTERRGASTSTFTGRVVKPPSWGRVARRAPIFGVLVYVTLSLIDKSGMTPAQRLVQTAVMLGFFLPFSFLMDSIAYRTYRRRTGQATDRKTG